MKEYESIQTLLDPVRNFGKVTVSTGYTNLDTVIVLSTGDGTRLPYPIADGPFNLIWYNWSEYRDPADDPNREIVRVTARTGDIITVTRPEEGTTATNKNLTGRTYKMILSVTAKTISDLPPTHSGAKHSGAVGNLLSGLTPTFTGWAGNPGTNADLVSEEFINLTTPGSLAFYTWVYIQYDLGSSKRLVASLLTQGQGISASVEYSNDNTTWRALGGYNLIAKARYLRFGFYSSYSSSISIIQILAYPIN